MKTAAKKLPIMDLAPFDVGPAKKPATPAGMCELITMWNTPLELRATPEKLEEIYNAAAIFDVQRESNALTIQFSARAVGKLFKHDRIREMEIHFATEDEAHRFQIDLAKREVKFEV